MPSTVNDAPLALSLAVCLAYTAVDTYLNQSHLLLQLVIMKLELKLDRIATAVEPDLIATV